MVLAGVAGRGLMPTPNPSREREGDYVALSSPLPPAGGAGGGLGEENALARAGMAALTDGANGAKSYVFVDA